MGRTKHVSSPQGGEPMSVAAYARHRGCDRQAVRKAIGSGRLADSLVMVDGKPKIADAELADREWAANTRPRGTTPKPGVPEEEMDLAEARRRSEIEKLRVARLSAERAELDLGERRGELVRLDEVHLEVVEAYTRVRNHLLAVPTRCRQRIPNLAAADAAVIDELIREALEELANDD